MERAMLSTKLFVPVTRKNSVHRTRLVSKLEAGAEQCGKLAFVCAPAGYGKTSLITNWLKTSLRSFVWLSLDGKDNDPQFFCSYLVAALQKMDGSIGQGVKKMLESSLYPDPETVFTLLINDISAASLPFVIVLDDYHLITNDYIHCCVKFLIENSPPLLHMVIITRQDPPFTLSKWRVRNQITEIRHDDLRFTDEEATKFFHNTMELNLSASQIACLNHKAEGWAAGLQLAALSIKGQERQRIEDFIHLFDGDNKYVVDYFFEEILQSQEEEIKQFLQKTAILSRFCAPLCDVLTGGGSEGILRRLEEADLFLIPLDDERKWYRFHHLFAEYLHTEINAGEEAILHRNASEWLQKNGFQTEAIDHALAGKDTDNAVRLIREQLADSVLSGEVYNFIHWLDVLSDMVVCSDAQLCSYKAFAHFLIAEMEKASFYVNALKTAPRADPPGIGRIRVVESWLANFCDDRAAVQLAENALTMIGDKDPFMRLFSLISLAHAQRKIGNLDESTKAFQEALSSCSDRFFPLPYCSITMDLAFNYYFQGHLQEAIRLCLDILNSGSVLDPNSLPAIEILNIPLAYFYLEADELALAKECVTKGAEAFNKLSVIKLFGGDAERVLAKIMFIQGRKADSIKLLSKCLEDAIAAGLPATVVRFRASLAEIQFRCGNIVWVENWIRESKLTPDGEINSSRETFYLVYARLLISQEKWEDAKVLLRNLEVFSRKGQKKSSLIIVLLLKALLWNELESIPNVIEALAEAVELAAVQNYRRSFLNEGKKLICLLPLVKERAPDFVDSLIKDCEASAGLVSSVKKSKYANAPLIENNSYLYEHLSDRELELLGLVSSGLSNGQIAAKLYISVGTVKWHMNHILAKLNAKNRTQAVNRALQLKLIDDFMFHK